MQALVVKHFLWGGYYPVGGSARIAQTLLGTVAAGLVSAGLLFARGAEARKQAIPLGPFLAAGALVVLLFL